MATRRDIRVIIDRIAEAASRVSVEGNYRVAYFDEGFGMPGVYILFFKPRFRPDFVATIKFDTGLVTWTEERLIANTEAALKAVLGT